MIPEQLRPPPTHLLDIRFENDGEDPIHLAKITSILPTIPFTAVPTILTQGYQAMDDISSFW